MPNRHDKQLWTENRLVKEQTRAIFVVAVTGIFGVVRYGNIPATLSASFTVFGWINVLDLLIVFWVGYLVAMVFAISDDLFGISFALVARGIAYTTFVIGLYMVLYVSAFIALQRVLGSPPIGLVGLVVFVPSLAFACFMEARVISGFVRDWITLRKSFRKKKNASWSLKLENFISAS